MATILDTGALVRPALTAADFTATKWDTSEDKAKFANNLCRFIASDFKTTMFTDKLCHRLAMMFGHIAPYNKVGFTTEFFEDLRGKVAFIEQSMMWRPCGDPAWTHSDVERAVLRRLQACNLLAAYRQLRATEIDGAERELLRRLQAKFAGQAAPVQPPVLDGPSVPKPTETRAKTTEQSSLFGQRISPERLTSTRVRLAKQFAVSARTVLHVFKVYRIELLGGHFVFCVYQLFVSLPFVRRKPAYCVTEV